MRRVRTGLSVMLMLFAAVAVAVAAARTDFSVEGAWARTPPAGAQAAAGYLVLLNHGPNATLVGASSPWASSVALHESRVEGGMMRMNPVASLPVPHDGRVVLSPGGLHLMFMALMRPWHTGDQVPLTLRFADGQTVDLSLTVSEQAGGQSIAH